MIENLYALAFEIVLFAFAAICVHIVVEMRLKRVRMAPGLPPTANLSPALFKAVVMIGCGLMLMEVGETILPLSGALKRMGAADYQTQLLKYLSIFFAIGLLFIAINYWLSILLYSIISRGQKVFEELKADNWTAPILFGALYLGLSLLSGTELAPVLDYLIPYPEIPMFE